jgi:hypothetical protein
MSNPGPNVTATSNVTGENTGVDGHQIGGAAAALVGFWGATPLGQPTAAAQAVVTDSSGGIAAPTNGILTLTGTYNSAIIANALATLAAQSNAIRNALVSIGIIKGA